MFFKYHSPWLAGVKWAEETIQEFGEIKGAEEVERYTYGNTPHPFDRGALDYMLFIGKNKVTNPTSSLIIKPSLDEGIK